MIVPFVHRWMVGFGWWGDPRPPGGARHARASGGVCGRSRQAAMTSTIPARETAAASIPQVARVMRIGLSFRSGSDKFSLILVHRGGAFQRGFAPAADT